MKKYLVENDSVIHVGDSNILTFKEGRFGQHYAYYEGQYLNETFKENPTSFHYGKSLAPVSVYIKEKSKAPFTICIVKDSNSSFPVFSKNDKVFVATKFKDGDLCIIYQFDATSSKINEINEEDLIEVDKELFFKYFPFIEEMTMQEFVDKRKCSVPFNIWYKYVNSQCYNIDYRFRIEDVK